MPKICSVCNLPQYETPGGLSCDNGHGGAPSVEEAEQTLASDSNPSRSLAPPPADTGPSELAPEDHVDYAETDSYVNCREVDAEDAELLVVECGQCGLLLGLDVSWRRNNAVTTSCVCCKTLLHVPEIK